MNQSIGQTKVSLGAVVVVLLLLGLGFLAILVKMGRSEADPVADALSAMRSQVAAEIELKVDPASARVFDPAGTMYYVCGEATLNRPGNGPLALDHVTQRYIVTMNKESRNGVTLFDGSSDKAGQLQFQLAWNEKCATAEAPST